MCIVFWLIVELLYLVFRWVVRISGKNFRDVGGVIVEAYVSSEVVVGGVTVAGVSVGLEIARVAIVIVVIVITLRRVVALSVVRKRLVVGRKVWSHRLRGGVLIMRRIDAKVAKSGLVRKLLVVTRRAIGGRLKGIWTIVALKIWIEVVTEIALILLLLLK